MDRRTVGTLLVLCSAAGFGTLSIFGELSFRAGLSISSALTLRFVIATAVVWGVLAVQRARGEWAAHPTDGGVDAVAGASMRLTPRSLVAALLLGAVGYAGMSGLFFLGVQRLSAGLATVVLYLYPLFVVALAATVLDESVGRRTLAAVPLALVGVALVSGASGVVFDPLGVAATLAAGGMYAVYITASRAVLDDVDERVLTAYVMPAAACSYLAYGAATGSLTVPTTTSGWAIVVGLAIVATVVPVFTFFAGLKRVGASRAGVLSTFEPVTAVVLGVAFLGETVTPPMVLGSALILSTVYLVQHADDDTD